MWAKLQHIDSRVIYVVLIIAMAIPLLRPISLPMKIMPFTRQAYEAINALPDGAKVLLSFDYGAGSTPELDPMAQAFLKHMARKNVKVYATSSVAEGPLLARSNVNKVYGALGKTYGQDYILLPFFAGGEATISSLCQNFKGVFKSDLDNKPIDSFPIMKDIGKIQDFALTLTINTGPGGAGTPDAWMRQVFVTHRQKLMLGVTAIMVPSEVPLLQANQIIGLVGGLRGAAEYERLIDAPADATRAMDAQSTAHVTILTLIILGNIGYWVNKNQAKGKGV